MNLAGIADLGDEWRTRAETLRAYGAAGPADAVERCAAEFEERLREWWAEPLSLRTAAEESGFSYDRLQRMVGEGGLPNVGKPGAPLVRRCDLPRKGERIVLSPGGDLVRVRRQRAGRG